MINLDDIIKIKAAEENENGYEIVFSGNNIIWMRKRRTIVGLLLLIKYGICSEADLSGHNNRLSEVKELLKGKCPDGMIQDRYGDANKPFSELWTEEGFSFIRPEGLKGNRQYVLDVSDHDLLFQRVAKIQRIQLTKTQKQDILHTQHNKCNLCGSSIKDSTEIKNHTFAKDRIKTEYDHRIPIEKDGTNDIDNFQALCHYCNKCKRQMCFICTLETCDRECVLVKPEKSYIVKATGENISDRMGRPISEVQE